MKILLKLILKLFYHLRFYRIISNTIKPIVIIDIDNTIADTWPTINEIWDNTFERHINLKPLLPVIGYIKSNYPNSKFQWIFLTSRNYYLHNTTRKWLMKSSMFVERNIILVQSPSEKIDLFKKYLNKSFVYFDDLSYNHENNKVLFYEDALQYIKSRGDIIYFGYSDLEKIKLNYE